MPVSVRPCAAKRPVRDAAGAALDPVIRDPQTGDALPAEGRTVELTTYWRRRLAAGEVEIVPPRSTRARRSDAPPAPSQGE